MSKERIDYLLSGWIAKTLNAEDLREFSEWMADEKNRNEFMDSGYELSAKHEQLPAFREHLLPLFEKTVAIDRPPVTMLSQPAPHRVVFLRTAWFRWAAIFILIATGAVLYLWNTQQKENPASTAVASAQAVKNDVAPGFERAVLTLSNGEQVVLDSAASGVINDGSLAIENVDGQLRYGGNPPPPAGGTPFSKEGEASSLAFNTMTTPKGGRYKLTLADGTKVWLNAASSITFPTSFTGSAREVKVTGEVYFDVAKDIHKKFRVTGNGVSIEVLGTSFNMNLYLDETDPVITLLEGKIRLEAGNNEATLSPGQQATVGSNIRVNSSPDITMATAWKNGVFSFADAEIDVVLRQVARWYDIEVLYPRGVPDIRFGGTIQNSLPLSEMLDALSAAGMKYKLEQKKLTVLP